MEGFTYHEDKFFPTIEIKLDGKTMSIQELVRAAEAMRQELLKYGVTVGIKQVKVSENG